MEKTNYTWETTFETSEETMTHTFSNRVKVVCDFRFGIVTTFRDGEAMDKFSIVENEMTIEDYEKFLAKIAEGAEQLNDLDNVCGL